jgi:hypothetical protein
LPGVRIAGVPASVPGKAYRVPAACCRQDDRKGMRIVDSAGQAWCEGFQSVLLCPFLMHMSIGGCTRAWSLCVCTCTGGVVLVNNSSCTQTMHTIAALENAHLKGACACTCTTGC